MSRPRPVWNEVEVAHRLPWLLVFRAIMASVLLAATVILDVANWQLTHVSSTLYAVAAGSFLLVVILGSLLRNGIHALVLGSVHLAAAIFTAYLVVDATGGIDSGFSFLYVLAIIDGAIIGGRRVALAVAIGCTLVFGGHLVAQLYGYTAGTMAVDVTRYANAVVTHLTAFFLTALLAGYLGELLRAARDETSTARSDRDRAERLHEAILESLPLAVMTVDDGYEVLTANAAASQILGLPRETLVGGVVPAQIAALVGDQARAAEVPYEIDGHRKLLSVSFVQTDVLTRRLGVLVVEDRTQVRALEQDLQTKERLASLGQLAAGIAHEIRNPLAAISGAVELMRDSDDATSRSSLEDIVVREIERLNTMIHDFLSYARPMRPERARVDVTALARDVASLISQDPRWESRRLSVKADAPVFAEIDAGQFRQVLWNLLRNAVEASPQDSTVELWVEEHDGSVHVTVLDEGPGLAPEVKKHLFEPFRTTKSDGTGLGLAMVHRIVEAHDGDIDIVNREGRGASAKVRLPSASAN